MSDLALMLRLQACVTAFLAELSRDRLIALVEGEARLTVTERADDTVLTRAMAPVDPETAPVPTPRSRRSSTGVSLFEADVVAARLRACETVDQGTELLASLKVSAADMKLLARALNIPPASRKDETAKKILNLTLGSRSKHAGLRQG